ncbi:MAG: MBL fold metallo-hydrolase [Leptospira sp.]|nr:MBL fold metallo-hydrolase [Leptospira sp.]
MEIKFYGVRGSCPTPITREEYQSKLIEILDESKKIILEEGIDCSSKEIFNRLPDHLKQNIGGNTTCLYVKSRSGQHYIFDMGTGIRVLGNDLAPLAFGGDPLNLNIFMTHTHWDHIQGWPFFKPAYSPKTNIKFYSCIKNLQERLERQQIEENFPITLGMMPSKKEFQLMTEHEEISVGDLKITPFFLKHPGSCTGYKISEGSRSFIFATDVEFRPEELDYLNAWKDRLGEAELLIIDAQYSSEEADKKIGWGHTSVQMAVEVADRIGVSKVALTHFEPDHTDRDVLKIVDSEIGLGEHRVEVVLAKEGLSFTLD